MVTPQESGVLSRWRLSRSLSCVRSCREDTSAYSTDTTELMASTLGIVAANRSRSALSPLDPAVLAREEPDRFRSCGQLTEG